MTTTDEKATRLPVIGEFIRHQGKLVAIEVIPPPPLPPPATDYIFEEITATGELRRNGLVLKEFPTYCDGRQPGGCVREVIEGMKDYAKKNSIMPASEVELVVIRITRQFRARPISGANYYCPGVSLFKTLEWGSSHRLPADVKEVVWSSKNLEASP